MVLSKKSIHHAKVSKWMFWRKVFVQQGWMGTRPNFLFQDRAEPFKATVVTCDTVTL